MARPGERPAVGTIAKATMSRRRFLGTTLGGLAVAGLGGGLVSACGGGGDGSTSGGNGRTTPVKIGVIAPFTGPGAFIGDVVNRSFDAALAEVEARGGLAGFAPRIESRDGGVFATQARDAYQDLAGDPDLLGILWCGSPGLEETLPQIQRDGIPVIAVFNDIHSDGLLYPDGDARSVFQTLQADTQAFDLLARYCAEDREFERVALIYDTLLNPGVDAHFRAALERHGLDEAGVETFQFGASDFGPQLQRLKDGGCHALFVWGLASETAGIVKQLDAIGAGYVDRDRAVGRSWAPQLMGSPAGLGEKKWAELAGSSARAGTLTTWYVGGLVANPSFPIREWVARDGGGEVTGGEDGPANGMAALLVAADAAGSTDRDAIVEALETVPEIQFASPVGYHFTAERHLALEPEDLVLITLERADAEQGYELGTEFEEVFPEGYVGPTQLVGFTLEANRRKHPEVMEEILELGYGTYCERFEGTARSACEAVH